uniref:Uncharacterized protein n=1 Tax=Candidatus Methanogaster sp. ANME-2c ERB4 TaxID=2759911 RepID=A0A7G9YC60_9EURY|nr:hypothetical protein APKMFMID_00013 [Methanosarcinales archaeon ANME-2c ERB4]QNO45594.1 hypothetical protein MGFDKJCL_00029 [Methanosarcinales archaeon ANME-2c ERB4]
MRKFRRLNERGLSYLMRYCGHFEVEYSDICSKLREMPVWCGGVVTVIAGLIFILDSELFLWSVLCKCVSY